jgi:cyclophilin family peptidyl-prolyl cis-trans isomerase
VNIIGYKYPAHRRVILTLYFFLLLIGHVKATQPTILQRIGDRIVQTNAPPLAINLTNFVKADPATNLVRVTTSLSASNGVPLGFTLQLFPAEAPKTVANFLSYVNDGAYENTLIHRSVPGFVIQTGGYDYYGNVIPTWTNIILSEASNGRSNIRGTLAMALVGSDSNSATDQWFVNLTNNSRMDKTVVSTNIFGQVTSNPPFTVFAQVIGQGMKVVDAIAALNITNIGGAFSELPLRSTNTPNPLSMTNLVHITRVATIPYFALSSDNAVYAPRISNSTLFIDYVGGTNPPPIPVTITLFAHDSNGLSTNTTFKVWNLGNVKPKIDYISQISYSTNSIYNYLYYPTLPDGTRITNVSFSWTPGLVNPNKNYAISGTGTLTVTAVSAPTLFYQGSSNNFKIRIGYNQNINFPKITTNSSNTITFTTNQISLNATSTSKLPVSYSVKGPGRISTANLFLNGSGTVSIVAIQPGNSNYLPAPSVTNNLVVKKSSQTIAFPQIPNQNLAGTIPLKATTSSGLPITYRIVSGTNATLTSDPAIKITSRGRYSVSASQPGNSGYLPATPVTNSFQYRLQQTLSPLQKVNSFIYTNNPPISFRVMVPTTTARTATNVILTASGPATISSNSLVTVTGAGTITLTATQTGDDVYFPASVSTSFTVEKASQRIFPFATITPKTNGMTPFSVAIPAINSPNPVSIRASGAGYISGTNRSNVMITLTNAGSVTLTATQSGNNNYLAALPATNVISVAKGNQSIVFNETDHQIGDLVELSAYSTNAAGLPTGLPITYQVLSSPQIGYLTNGNEIQTISTGTITVVAAQNGSSGYYPARSVTNNFVVAVTNPETNTNSGTQSTGGTLNMGQGNPTPYYPPVITNGTTTIN